MSEGGRLRVVSFTTLFPNRARPLHGLFVRRRLERMARECDLEVVAPVNVLEDPRFLWEVPYRETLGHVQVYHPRFGVIPGLFKQWDGELLFRQVLSQIRKTVPVERGDLVDVHYAYPDGVAGQLLAEEIGKPFVISLRGSDIRVLTQFPRRRELIQRMLHQASAIIAVSTDLRREAERLGAEAGKIHVIPNGVDTTVFFPRDRTAARERLGWPHDAYVILSVGRLDSIKGFDLLIRSVRAVRDRMKHTVRCYIVGEGRLRPALEREITRCGVVREITLCGAIAPGDLPLFYSAADLFCLLSHSEGCPNVVLESLACGTPVVATAVGGVPEVVEEGVTGFLVTQRSEEEVADRIGAALETRWDPGVIAKSEAVRDWSEVACAQLTLFHHIVG